MNISTGKYPFQVVYGINPMGVLDLVHLTLGDKISDDREAFAKHIQKLQQQVRHKMQASNEQTKIIKYVH